MSAITADDRGLVVACPACGQNNRLAYERLDQRPRCAKCSAVLPAPAEPVELENDVAFEALTKRAALPVLVDFWAPWCGPCQMVAPELRKVAAAGVGRWLVAKVNTEVMEAPAMRYQVRAIPLLLVFRGGHEVARQAGALPAAAIVRLVEPHAAS